MKNSSSSLLLLPLFLFLFTNTAKGQFVTIPDANFRAKLQTLLPTCFNPSGQLNTACSAVTTLASLNVSNSNIGDLDGVQYFDGLQTLYCDGNQFPSLNVQGLTNLQTLYCRYNQLQSLNVQGLTNLQTLYCHYNQLQSLNVQGLTSLQTLYCNNNQLQSLNVQGLTSLQYLKCSYNQLTNLNVQGLTNLQSLWCQNNQLASLNVQGLTNLQTLECSDNPVSCIDSLPASLRYFYTWGTHLACIPNRPPNLSVLNLPVCQGVCSCGEYSANAQELNYWNQTPASKWKHKPNAKANGGIYWNNRPAIASKSVSDGAWVLDADSLHLGNYATPISALLTSPEMNISSYTANTLFFSFHQYYRAYNSSTIVEYSLNHGSTWTSVPINTNVPNHFETANYDYKIIPINIANAPSDSLMVRFNFSGHGYFWILDDIKICDEYPSQTLPNPGLGEFMYYNNQPYEVDAHGHPYHPNEFVVEATNPAPIIHLGNGDELHLVSSCECDTTHLYQYVPQASLLPYPSATGKSIAIEERVPGATSSTKRNGVEPNYYVFSELQAGNGTVSNPPLYNLPAPGFSIDPPGTPLIAVLDSGIDFGNPTLNSKISTKALTAPTGQTKMIGYNVVDHNNNPRDNNGHGTHTAGIVVNTLGTHFPGCNAKILVIKTHDSNGLSTVFNAACGIHCAVNEGVKAINCSWGYYADSVSHAPIMYKALKAALDNNIPVICSAGNEGIEVGYPHLHFPSSFTAANLTPYNPLDNVVSVASSNNQSSISSFSNHSPIYVDVASLGESVPSNGLNGTTSTKSGTSMSAPVIAASFIYQLGCSPVSDSSLAYITNLVLNQCSFPVSSGTTASGNSILFDCCSALLGIISPDTMCVGDTIQLRAYGGSQYVWNTGATTTSITATAGGVYTISVTGATGCTATASKTVVAKGCLFEDPTHSCQSFTLNNVIGNNWYHFTNQAGKRILSINPQGLNLGNVTVFIKDTEMQPNANCSWSLLPRYFNLECTGANPFPSAVKVRLYFQNQELADFNTAVTNAGCSGALRNELGVLHYDGLNEDCEIANNQHGSLLILPDAITDMSYGSDCFYLETEVNGFSEFGAGTVNGSTLPIELLFFNAHKIDRYAKLDWATETERNNDYFIVDRSPNGYDNFIEIGKVKSAGNSSTKQNYTLNDYHPLSGVNYYRLRQVDLDGAMTMSRIIPLSFEGDFSAAVFPNPFNTNLLLEIKNPESQNLQIQMYDAVGREVYNQDLYLDKGTQTLNIEGQTFQPGIYLVRISTDSDNTEIKVIKY